MKKTCRTQLFFSILAFCGGFLDIFSFINRGGFSLMQTGNIIYSTIYFINGNIQYAAYCITLIFSFFTCLVISNLLKRKIDNVHKFRKSSFLIAAVILLICIFIPIDFQYSNVLPFQVKKTFLNLIGNILLSAVGAFIYNSTLNSYKVSITTMMMTANLGRLANSIFSEKKNVGFYAITILSFIAGLVSSYFIICTIGNNYVLANNYIDSLIYNLPLLITLFGLIACKFLYCDDQFFDK